MLAQRLTDKGFSPYLKFRFIVHNEYYKTL